MTVRNVRPSAAGRFEAELTTTFLPRCAKCEAPHPAARGGSIGDPCADCGTPSGRPVVRRVPASLIGLWVARALLAIGRILNSLARKV